MSSGPGVHHGHALVRPLVTPIPGRIDGESSKEAIRVEHEKPGDQDPDHEGIVGPTVV
jgi:hypothetical protein